MRQINVRKTRSKMADLVRAALLCPALSRSAQLCSACHKSRLLLNSNKLCQTLIEGGVKWPRGKGGGDTVVNTLFACVSRNFTMGKYFGPKVFTFRNGNKRKWHFYWPSKQFEQLPKCRTDCVQAGSSCVWARRRGRVVSSTDGKIENYEQKGKTFVSVREEGGGDGESTNWAAFSAAMAQKLICCRFQLDTQPW